MSQDDKIAREFSSAEYFALAAQGDAHFYDRISHPECTNLESELSDFFPSYNATVFSSGMAAFSSLLLSLLKPDIHVLMPTNIYGETKTLCGDIFKPWGVQTSYVEPGDLYHTITTQKPDLVLIETPTNPYLTLFDLDEIISACKACNATLILDNSMATPILQSFVRDMPDYILASATKGISGTSNFMAGIIWTRPDNVEGLRHVRTHTGSIATGFVCEQLRRCIPSLRMRIVAQSKSSDLIAKDLAAWGNDLISNVYYPTIQSPSLTIQQMNGYGGSVFSVEIKTSLKEARLFLNALSKWTIATSFGATKSTVQLCNDISFSSPGKTSTPMAIKPLIRFSTGLEDTQELLDDIKDNLSVISAV
jgi:cystathionine beta-lyase/cystathionine gamma-synthase